VTVPERRKKPSETRPPDIEIGATVRADRMRFDHRPETDVEFVGRSVAEDESGSERVNLPEEVEPGETYRDVTVGWRAAAWVEEVEDHRLKEAREGENP
jgi:hypothetical protein